MSPDVMTRSKSVKPINVTSVTSSLEQDSKTMAQASLIGRRKYNKRTLGWNQMEDYKGNSEKWIKRLRKSERSEILRKSERKWWEKRLMSRKSEKRNKYHKIRKRNKTK